MNMGVGASLAYSPAADFKKIACQEHADEEWISLAVTAAQKIQQMSVHIVLCRLARKIRESQGMCNVNGFALASLSIHGRQKAFKKAFKNKCETLRQNFGIKELLLQQ